MDCVSMFPRFERVQNYIQFVNEKKVEGMLGNTNPLVKKLQTDAMKKLGRQATMLNSPDIVRVSDQTQIRN